MRRRIIAVLVLILLAAPVIAETENAASSFKLPTLSGKTISLEQSLGSKLTILSFFASWSKSCKAEVAFLEYLHEKYSRKGIKIIGISFDRKSKVLQKFIDDQEIKFTVLHDKKLKTLKDYRILIIPTLFVIDSSGNIQSIYVDFDKNVKEALTQEIDKLLVLK
jgi:peroxiredoxin